MFFSQQRHQFFKPLTTKYREQVVECLRLMHQRLYGATAEYGQSLNREQVIDIFQEALARAPLLETEGEETEQRFKSLKEQANWILKLLLEFGWMEKQVDSTNLQSSYPLTRAGRLFALPLEEIDRRQIRTRHRNTRNTLNALEAFLNRGEVHDLLDALEYSERIIADFTDVISELEERKRDLAKEVESQLMIQHATNHFFEFMEKRFQPDLSVRLSADSVEKHRDRINQAITKIRRKNKDFKKEAELNLRTMAPDLIIEGQSVLWSILDIIDLRMRNAAEVMLPALRTALQSFTKRADILIRQLGYLSANRDDQWLKACNYLTSLPEEIKNKKLASAGRKLSTLNVRLTDPAQVKLIQRKTKRPIDSSIEEHKPLDSKAQKEIIIQSLLEQAFNINNQNIMTYIKSALAEGSRVSTQNLPIHNAHDLLAMAFSTEVASNNHLSSDYQLKVTYANKKQYSNRYFSKADEFIIELISENDRPTKEATSD